MPKRSKAKPRKETGEGVSSLAGAWMNKLNKALETDKDKFVLSRADCRELLQVCASALSQDETKADPRAV